MDGDHAATGTVRRHLTWVTSVTDGLDHAITDDAMSVGVAAGTGEYTATCGTVVLSAALVAPPGSRCPLCSPRLRH
ncbi:MAG TPA: hypothetical protein VF444_01370 [Pseudonocardiaceae bacterium]